MAEVLVAQRVQLNAMNGFVETELMRRFSTLNESQVKLQGTLAPSIANRPAGGQAPPSVGALLRVSNLAMAGAMTPLHGAHLIDRDLSEISTFTTKYENAASKIITPAANGCT